MGSNLESKTTDTFSRRMIQSFMDIIVLKRLTGDRLMSGYDLIKYFHNEFNILLSPGTVYSLLYSLERKNLIAGDARQRKMLYGITLEGEGFLKEVGVMKPYIQTFMSYLFTEQSPPVHVPNSSQLQ